MYQQQLVFLTVSVSFSVIICMFYAYHEEYLDQYMMYEEYVGGKVEDLSYEILKNLSESHMNGELTELTEAQHFVSIHPHACVPLKEFYGGEQ